MQQDWFQHRNPAFAGFAFARFPELLQCHQPPFEQNKHVELERNDTFEEDTQGSVVDDRPMLYLKTVGLYLVLQLIVCSIASLLLSPKGQLCLDNADMLSRILMVASFCGFISSVWLQGLATCYLPD